METPQNPIKHNRTKVNISEHRQLVSPSKSKKLAAIANRIAADLPLQADVVKPELSTGLKSEFEIALQHAQQLIDMRINEIMNSFPQGKRNNLFRFRYGSVETIKLLDITAAFKKLEINAPQHLNVRVLNSVNYYGDRVDL